LEDTPWPRHDACIGSASRSIAALPCRLSTRMGLRGRRAAATGRGPGHHNSRHDRLRDCCLSCQQPHHHDWPGWTTHPDLRFSTRCGLVMHRLQWVTSRRTSGGISRHGHQPCAEPDQYPVSGAVSERNHSRINVPSLGAVAMGCTAPHLSCEPLPHHIEVHQSSPYSRA
jgi:hypothetical protein